MPNISIMRVKLPNFSQSWSFDPLVRQANIPVFKPLRLRAIFPIRNPIKPGLNIYYSWAIKVLPITLRITQHDIFSLVHVDKKVTGRTLYNYDPVCRNSLSSFIGTNLLGYHKLLIK